MVHVLVKGSGGDGYLLIAIRNGAKVISHYLLVIHNTVVLGHHACVDDGGQLIVHNHGLESDHFGVDIDIFSHMQGFLHAVEIDYLWCQKIQTEPSHFAHDLSCI